MTRFPLTKRDVRIVLVVASAMWALITSTRLLLSIVPSFAALVEPWRGLAGLLTLAGYFVLCCVFICALLLIHKRRPPARLLDAVVIGILAGLVATTGFLGSVDSDRLAAIGSGIAAVAAIAASVLMYELMKRTRSAKRPGLPA